MTSTDARPGRRPVTVRVARWSAEHPWRAIVAWVVFVVVCFIGGNAAGLAEATGDDTRIGESGRADAIVSAGQFDHPATENVLITARRGVLDRAAAAEAAADATRRLRALPQVAGVGEPVPSADGSALLVPVTLSDGGGNTTDQVQPLLDATAAAQAAHPDLRIEEVGDASIDKALDETLGQDFQRAETLSVPITLVILLVAFGALIAAAVPLLLAITSVAAALGLSTLASHLVPATDVTASVILLIGLAVGVDYSLFYVRREREERARGREHLDAVEIAAETSGHAVVVSGVAVIISMAGLFFANDADFSALAVGSILVVAVAMLGSLTVLPALLAKLGRWVDRPRIPVLWRLTARRTGADGQPAAPRFWPAVLRPVLRRPVLALVISVGAMLALAAPALGMKLKYPGPEDLPRTTAAMQAYDRLTAAFPSAGTTHLVAVRAGADQAPAVRAALTGLAQRAAANPLFAPADGATTPIEVSADGTVTTLALTTPYPSRSDEARSSLDELRGALLPRAMAGVPGVEYAVGGGVAESADYAEDIMRTLPVVVGFVLALTFLVMLLAFRSVVVALTSILLNLLSAGAAYGLVVLVFQGTWAPDLLNFTSMDAVVSWLPLFLFVVLFGLSMDYHVFVVSRIREAAQRGMSTKDAVAHGITTSAGVVTSAAIVMVAVFSIFATLSTIDMKQLGLGLAAAILLDATIIRAVVLPALMTVLGRANWWAPRFLRRPRATAPADGPSEAREAELVAAG